MTLLSLKQQKKTVSCYFQGSFDVEIPAHANIKPSDIKVVFHKGWCTMRTDKVKKKRAPKMKIAKAKEKKTEDVF